MLKVKAWEAGNTSEYTQDPHTYTGLSGGSRGGAMGSMEPPFCRQLEDQPAHGTVYSREI